MLLDIIKKSIEDITLNELEYLYSLGIATIKVADNKLLFVQE